MTEIPNLFWSLKLGTRPQGGESGGPILEFDILQGSITLADCRKVERPLKPSQGASQSRVLRACIS